MVVVERCLLFLVSKVSLTSFTTAARLAPDEHPAFSGTAKKDDTSGIIRSLTAQTCSAAEFRGVC